MDQAEIDQAALCHGNIFVLQALAEAVSVPELPGMMGNLHFLDGVTAPEPPPPDPPPGTQAA
jgi:hypothetical protein